MSNSSLINASVHGRELGLQRLSSVHMGSTHPAVFLVGAEAVRPGVSTLHSTAGVMPPYGVSFVGLGTTVACVQTLGPPIPGVEKTLISSGASTAYVNTASATIISSVGTTQATLGFLGAGVVKMIGVTTAVWGLLGNTTGSNVNVAAST